MILKLEDILALNYREGRKEIINREEGEFRGNNLEGEEIKVIVKRDKFLELWKKNKNEESVWEIIEYNKEGERIGISYSIGKRKES